MLVIRNDQLAVFKQSAEDAFVVEMCAHCRAFAPELCATLDARQLHDAVRFAVAQAKAQGFDQRGPVQFFIDMMILFGAGFYQDPQYPWIAQLLAEPGSQIQRTTALHLQAKIYMAKVFGERNCHLLEAMRELSRLLPFGVRLTPDGFRDEVLALMTEIYPRKVAQVDGASLRHLIDHARDTGSKRYRLQELRSQALWATLMFAFGHEFDSDPFLPWLIRPFFSQHAADEPDRIAERIERRALIWASAQIEAASARA